MDQARVLPKITKGKGGQEGDKGQNKWKREQKEEKRKFKKLRENKKKKYKERQNKKWTNGCRGSGKQRRWGQGEGGEEETLNKPVLGYEQQEKVSSEPTLYAPTEIK